MVVGDELLQRTRHGTHQVGVLLAVLEEHEGGHGADAVLLGQVGDGVDVDLDVVDVGELVGPPVGGRRG